MIRDSRLSGVLHVLLHMAEHAGPVTSETLGRAMGTNAAVVRRTLAGLRAEGLVRSEKGHGGGWTLGRALDEVTIADIYSALGRPSLFAIGHRDADPSCLVEQAVNHHLDGALKQAEALLLGRMQAVSLADLSREFHARFAASAAAANLETAHG
jgi:DNA-binding IscR family transcriptional regulator